MFFIIGILDDLFALSPIPRLIGQIIISIFSWSNGLKIFADQLPIIGNFFIDIPFSESLSLILTIIWIVGITNAFNWLDGLDGLASGVSIISLTGFILLGFLINNSFIVLFSSIILGSNLGFLFHNFYPAKIYMGDSGSYFLGSIISLIAIYFCNNNITKFNLIYPLIIFSYPILDMTFVIFKRIIQSRSPFYPDTSHLHQRLLDSGFTHRKSVLSIYIINIFTLMIFFIIFKSFYLN